MGMQLAARIAKNAPIMRKMSTARDPQTGAYKQPANPPPGPLGIRSGDLAAGIRPAPSKIEGGKAIVGLMVVGVKYWAVHEYGATINHPGSSKFQRFGWRGNIVFTNYTRPHVIKIRPRPYLKPAVERAMPTVRQIIDRRAAALARKIIG